MKSCFASIYDDLKANTPIMKAVWTLIFLFVFGLFTPENAKATHIVGGDLQVTCIGGFRYEIKLIMRRDCEFGDPEADYDDPAIIGVFTGDGQILQWLTLENSSISTVPLEFPGDDTLNQTLISDCDLVGTPVCVQEATYTGIVDLRPGATDGYENGFIFAYQRCCRNETLANVENPLNTGATWTTRISEESFQACNSTPKLGDYPPIYICASEEFQYDASVTEADGDSIAYSLCTPYQGATMQDPMPQQAVEFKPPYDPVEWANPYALNDLLGNPSDPLEIDPETGFMTGTPNALGQYTVGICVKEYRNGKLLSEIRRDFELNVRLCTDGADAQIDVPNPWCEGLTVDFGNASENAAHYKWFFDYENNPSAQSTEFEPSYTYPGTGTYEVLLIATDADSVCFDTTRMFLDVQINGVISDFTYEVESCDEEIVLNATDESIDTIENIVEWNWILEGENDTLTSSQQNPTFILQESQTVVLTLEAISSNGCAASVTKTFDVNVIDLPFLGDSLIICPGESTPLLENADPDFDYTWSPDGSLDLTEPHNPIASPDEPTTYYVTVTDGLCEVSDSVYVDLYEEVTFTLSDISDSCDIERTLTISIDTPHNVSLIEWSNDSDFNNILGTGDTIVVNEPLRKYYYARVTDDVTGCMFTDSLFVESFAVNAEYDDDQDFCIEEEEMVTVTNIDPFDTLDIIWDPSDFIISDLEGNSVTVYSDVIDSGYISFTATNQFGCTLTDSIFISFAYKPDIAFSYENECGSLTVDFTNESDSASYLWDFGDGTTSTDENPQHTYNDAGTYTVILQNQGVCVAADTQEVTVFEYENTVPDTAISCFGEPVGLNPGGDTSLTYIWSPSDFFGPDSTATNPIVDIDETMTFYVEISFPNADCSILDTVTVHVPDDFDVSVDAGDTLQICDDVPQTLTATVTHPGVDIMWLDDQGNTVGTGDTITVPYDESEYYVAKGTDEFGCMKRDTVYFGIDLIEITIDTDVQGDFICVGDTAKVIITNNDPGDDLSIEWIDDPSIISPLDSNVICVVPGSDVTYVVNVTNEQGCSVTDSVTISVQGSDLLDIELTADPNPMIIGDTVQLDVLNGQANWDYVWGPAEDIVGSNTIQNPLGIPDTTTTFCVTVTDENGCTATDCITVQVTIPPCTDEFVFLPNAFSPNGDGVNDQLCLRSNIVDNFHLVIYNRWGEKVFETRNMNKCWDGTHEGEALKPDVFAYYLTADCINGGEFAKEGNINLLK